MLGIQARIIPEANTNNIGVDDKLDFSIEGHSEVKGQVSAIMQKNNILITVTSFFHHKRQNI